MSGRAFWTSAKKPFKTDPGKGSPLKSSAPNTEHSVHNLPPVTGAFLLLAPPAPSGSPEFPSSVPSRSWHPRRESDKPAPCGPQAGDGSAAGWQPSPVLNGPRVSQAKAAF